MRYLILVAFSTTFFLSCKTSQHSFATPGDAIASTATGPVRGFSADGIYIFKGIPYAQAERFMPPRPVASWKEVRSTVSYGPVCPQNTPKVINESEFFFHHDFGFPSENCLSLNIWTPGIQDHRKRPVMVWLHGGGFATGSGNELPSYDGENLSRKGDVVVVNLNHRLNVLGFLDLSAFGEKYKNTGNMGMLDIVAALQWVKENIQSFGGDPGNITIFGQSGGGRKVTALLSMPGAKGLFNKAIIQSGAALSFYQKNESQRIGKLVAARLGLTESTIDSIQHIPYERLREAGE
ncbi:MAG: carboxylesterase/lipase family protein [Chitinophagaceae bacterium]|nr:carboxylesterase/lipase family protein [Chitinophagaceae bacterium]